MLKYKNLQGTIKTQLEQYTQSVQKMEYEMLNKFPTTNDLAEKFENDKERLMNIKQLVGMYKHGLAKQSTYHAMRHDTRKNQIVQSDIYNRLNESEKRLISNES